MRDFLSGIADYLRATSWWRRQPRILAVGLIPGALVGILLTVAFAALLAFLDPLTRAMTPFADGWDAGWAVALRVALGIALSGGALLLYALSFTALTLIVGEPFYDRIWRAVEKDLTGTVPEARYGFWRSVGDGLGLLVRGIGVAVLCMLIGLIPVAGSVLAAIVGVLLSGRLLVSELTTRALSARGWDAARRKEALRAHRARSWGFGVAVQLSFMVPLGAVLLMPVAVAGSTQLAIGWARDPHPA